MCLCGWGLIITKKNSISLTFEFGGWDDNCGGCYKNKKKSYMHGSMTHPEFVNNNESVVMISLRWW